MPTAGIAVAFAALALTGCQINQPSPAPPPERCTSTTDDAKNETATHHVTILTTETRCDGKLVDVATTTVRVQKPVPRRSNRFSEATRDLRQEAVEALEAELSQG